MADLAKHIRKQLSSGKPPDAVRMELIVKGQRPVDVDRALNSILSEHGIGLHDKRVPPGSFASPPGASEMGAPSRLLNLVFRPGRFFDSVSSDAGLGPPLKFYLLVMLAQLIAVNAVLFDSLFLSSPDGTVGFGGMFTDLLYGLTLANIYIVCGMAATFVLSALMHILVLIAGGRGGYQNTYKAIAYSSLPTSLIWLGLLARLALPEAFLPLAAASALWVLALGAIGLPALHALPKTRGIALSIALTILILLIPAGIIQAAGIADLAPYIPAP